MSYMAQGGCRNITGTENCMITGELRNRIDRIWETFWTGGITNPLDVIEQFTYLLFIKQLDDVETTKENEANFLGVPFESVFPDDLDIKKEASTPLESQETVR